MKPIHFDAVACTGSPYVRMVMLAVLAATMLTLAGCSRQEVYGQLSERQVNEMVAVLRKAGIDANKQKREANQFALTTSASDFSRAVEILNASGYPRSGHDSLGQVFKKEGFVSSATEERSRLIHAMQQEMANSLSLIDGVIEARVHLNIPERDPLASDVQPSSASVLIKHKKGVDMSAHIASIKALVVDAFPGLKGSADGKGGEVTVALFPSEDWSAKVAAPEPTGPLRGLDVPIAMAASLGGAALLVGGGAWAWQRRRSLPTERAVTPHRHSQPTGR
jgi:type III secretion protein J